MHPSTRSHRASKAAMNRLVGRKLELPASSSPDERFPLARGKPQHGAAAVLGVADRNLVIDECNFDAAVAAAR